MRLNGWRHPAPGLSLTTVRVRFVHCLCCGRKIGGDIEGCDPVILAKEMRDVARQHAEATGHKAFFFGDGRPKGRPGTRKRRVP